MPYPFLKKRVAENIDKELLKSMVCAIRYVICIAQTMMMERKEEFPFIEDGKARCARESVIVAILGKYWNDIQWSVHRD